MKVLKSVNLHLGCAQINCKNCKKQIAKKVEHKLTSKKIFMDIQADTLGMKMGKHGSFFIIS